MGAIHLKDRSNGKVIDSDWFDRFRQVLMGDVVPRNDFGVAESVKASLGEEAYQWLRAFIQEGYWEAGDIKKHHSFGGIVGPGHGWMLCDGRLVNQTTYDSEHGAGSWAQFVVASPLDGKYLPNFPGRYPVGAATTPATGVTAIPAVGNAGHQITIEHLHKWYRAMLTSSDKIYDSNGNEIALVRVFQRQSVLVIDGSSYGRPGADMYTTKSLPTAKSIQPDSIELQFYMRII